MAKKKSATNAPKAGESTSASALEARFWNCLKKCDAEGLEEMLLVRRANSDTGGVSLHISAAAASLVNAPSAKKMLPLSYAVGQGMDEAGLRVLLRCGAAVDAADGSAERTTALHAACWREDDVAASLLLSCGADPTVVDAEGRTPLHVLASLNAVGLFSYFLETCTATNNNTGGWKEGGPLSLEGCSPVVVSAHKLLSKKDVSDFTVLHTAVSYVNNVSDQLLVDLLDFMSQMASKDPAAVERLVNMKTDSGSTALQLLLSSPNLNDGVIMRTTESLLKLGANPATVDKWGQTSFVSLLLTHSGTTAANVLRVLLNALKNRATKEQLEDIFLRWDEENGFALIHHAIASGNVDAVKVMVEFLQSIDSDNGMRYVQQWLGEVPTKKGVQVAFMLAERVCNEIAHILLSANAINEATYRRCKEECEHQKKEQEKKEREELERQHNEHEEEEEEGVDGNGNCVVSKNYGDYSGFGSTANAGFRVQQARKARTKAMLKKKQNSRRNEEEEAEGPALNQNFNSPWLLVALAFVILLILLRGYSMLRDSLKNA